MSIFYCLIILHPFQDGCRAPVTKSQRVPRHPWHPLYQGPCYVSKCNFDWFFNSIFLSVDCLWHQVRRRSIRWLRCHLRHPHHRSALIYGNATPMGFLTLIVTKPTPNLLRKTLSDATNKSLSFPLYHCLITRHQITLIKTKGNLFCNIKMMCMNTYLEFYAYQFDRFLVCPYMSYTGCVTGCCEAVGFFCFYWYFMFFN